MKKFILFMFFAMAAVAINTYASPTKVDICKDVGIHATINAQSIGVAQTDANIIYKNFPGEFTGTHNPVILVSTTLAPVNTVEPYVLSVLNFKENSINSCIAEMCRTVNWRYCELNNTSIYNLSAKYNKINLPGNKCHRNC